jgi:hypothetical protein
VARILGRDPRPDVDRVPLSASVHGGIVELRLRLPHRLIAIVLAPVMFVFAVIKTITDDNSPGRPTSASR